MITKPLLTPRARTRWLLVWAFVSIAAVVVAFFIASRIRSPWTPAIANAATTLTATALVEHRTVRLDTSIPVGIVSAGTEFNVTPASTPPLVVTAAVVKPGDPVTSGMYLTEVSGRPIIALTLPFPLYRDLSPGMSGSDVSAVQEALSALGLYHGSIDGQYGAATADAVGALYRHVSRSPPAASTEAIAQVSLAQEDLDEAQKELATAQRELAVAQAEPEVDLSALQGAVEDAQASVTKAKTAVTQAELLAMTPLPRGEITRIPSAAEVVSVQPTGSELSEETPAVVLRTSAPSVTVRVSMANAPSFLVGSEVEVVSVADAVTTTGAVVSVGEFDANPTEAGAPPGYDVVIGLNGLNGLVDAESVKVLPTAGEPSADGNAVPLTALREGDGSTYVIRASGPSDSTGSRVPVTVLAASDGWAVVEGDLTVGDRVLLGL